MADYALIDHVRDPAVMLAFWKRVGKIPMWKKMLDAAYHLDYSLLKSLFELCAPADFEEPKEQK